MDKKLSGDNIIRELTCGIQRQDEKITYPEMDAELKNNEIFFRMMNK